MNVIFQIAVLVAIGCAAADAQQLVDSTGPAGAGDIIDNTIPETDDTDSATNANAIHDTAANTAASNAANPSSGALFDWVKITESPPSKVFHPAGTSVELECEATGSPAPSITWVRGKSARSAAALNAYASNAVSSSSKAPSSPHSLVRVRSRLIIDRADPAPYEYTCIAQAGGKIAAASATVYGPLSAGIAGMLKSAAVAAAAAAQADGVTNGVIGYTLHANRLAEGLRKPRIVSYYNVIFEQIGNAVFLPCTAVGSPSADVYWLDNEEQLIGSAGTAAPGGARLRVTPDGELLIGELKWSDMGTYRCVARSALGKDMVTTFVYPMLN